VQRILRFDESLTLGPLQTHSRIMPFLLPPAEFRGPDLDAQGLSGTCEVQICRSAGNWSMGFQNCTEQSIQNAYLKGSLCPRIILNTVILLQV
jgi:hypothetical protein